MPLTQRAPAPQYDVSEWMSAGETAHAYGVSLDSIYRALKRGDLPFQAIKIGGQWRIRRSEFNAAIATMSPEATAALLDGEAQ